MKKIHLLMSALALSLAFSACSSDDNASKPEPEPNPADSLENENRYEEYDIQFKTKVINNAEYDKLTDDNMRYMTVLGVGHQLVLNSGFLWQSFCSYMGIHDYYTYSLMGSYGNEPYKWMERNRDDRSIWEMFRVDDPEHAPYKFRLTPYNWVTDLTGNGLPISVYAESAYFLAWSAYGDCPNTEEALLKSNVSANVKYSNSRSENGSVVFTMSNDGETVQSENRIYYPSEELCDFVIAEASVDNSRWDNRQPVELNFTHPLARLQLKGIQIDDDAIEVTVHYAAIGGISMKGEYCPKFCTKNPGTWTPIKSPYQEFIEMKLHNPVKLNAKEAQNLCEAGAEPWVIPQNIEKGWTNVSARDGAGIMLGVTIKNKYDGSYIVGSANEYGLVYMSLEPIKLESENNYVFEVKFGAHSDENGLPSGYHISYSPQIINWGTTEKNVEMKKK